MLSEAVNRPNSAHNGQDKYKRGQSQKQAMIRIPEDGFLYHGSYIAVEAIDL